MTILILPGCAIRKQMPRNIAAAIIGHLKAALEDIETLSEELEPNGVEKPPGIVEAAE